MNGRNRKRKALDKTWIVCSARVCGKKCVYAMTQHNSVLYKKQSLPTFSYSHEVNYITSARSKQPNSNNNQTENYLLLASSILFDGITHIKSSLIDSVRCSFFPISFPTFFSFACDWISSCRSDATRNTHGFLLFHLAVKQILIDVSTFKQRTTTQ